MLLPQTGFILFDDVFFFLVFNLRSVTCCFKVNMIIKLLFVWRQCCHLFVTRLISAALVWDLGGSWCSNACSYKWTWWNLSACGARPVVIYRWRHTTSIYWIIRMINITEPHDQLLSLTFLFQSHSILFSWQHAVMSGFLCWLLTTPNKWHRF